MTVTPRQKNRKLASPSMAQRVEQDLRERITCGVFRPGAMLPSRRQLASEYGVALLTVEQAMKTLVADGVLRAENGRGTFVAHQKGKTPLQETGAPAETTIAAQTPNAAAFEPIDRSSSPIQIAGKPASKAVAAHSVGVIADLYLFNQDHLALNNFWVRLLVHSMEKEFSDDGKMTQFFNRVTDAETPLIPLTEAISNALDSGVDALAIIALGHDRLEVDRSLSRIEHSNIPMVCITSGDLRCPIPFVSLDNHSAGYQAARHLLNAGHREFLFIAPFASEWVHERLDGVQAATEHAGLHADAVRVFPPFVGPWNQSEDPEVYGYEAAVRALQEGIASPAVICANDGVAIGYMRGAAEAGLAAGIDYALISFDDHPSARGLGLSTMRPPMEAMGREASRMLRLIMAGNQVPSRVRMQWELIPRTSTRVSNGARISDTSLQTI